MSKLSKCNCDLWEVNNANALNIDRIVSNGVKNEVQTMFTGIIWFLTTFWWLNMRRVTLIWNIFAVPRKWMNEWVKDNFDLKHKTEYRVWPVVYMCLFHPTFYTDTTLSLYNSLLLCNNVPLPPVVCLTQKQTSATKKYQTFLVFVRNLNKYKKKTKIGKILLAWAWKVDVLRETKVTKCNWNKISIY